ncbi:trypsin-like peptidase domain-containing protein, partial [Candidatus Pacearchaeota archaeon]|nr:trypsin-like peptidase domain-containing protein [Candidatus Pacearchaeota archaeon]
VVYPDLENYLDAFDTLVDGVVRIRCLNNIELLGHGDSLRCTYQYGTGFCLDRFGLILTACHIVTPSRAAFLDSVEIAVKTQDVGYYAPASVVAMDEYQDIAILLVNPQVVGNRTTYGWSEVSKPEFNDLVYAIGIRADAEPAHSEVTLVRGHVVDVWALFSKLDKSNRPRDSIIFFSAEIENGFSGGPILSADGQLIGMTLGAPSLADRWQDFSYGVSIQTINDFVSDVDLEEEIHRLNK